MNATRYFLSIFLPLPLFVSPLPVSAHSNKPHQVKSELSMARFEQMPWGIGVTPKEVTQTVEVVMNDSMRFAPSNLSFREGDIVRFRIRNEGKLMHEFVIGTEESNREHAELMKRFPNMEHDEPYMAHVAPGDTRDLTWMFNRSGDFQFACIIAGHFDAGMVGSIVVTKSR
jgi:uncharacterized cupredoxin-like copper-binding protein